MSAGLLPSQSVCSHGGMRCSGFRVWPLGQQAYLGPNSGFSSRLQSPAEKHSRGVLLVRTLPERFCVCLILPQHRYGWMMHSLKGQRSD